MAKGLFSWFRRNEPKPEQTEQTASEDASELKDSEAQPQPETVSSEVQSAPPQAEQAEAARLEAERVAAEQAEAARLEAERVAAEQA
ncbi:fused signal recognition particle receptor, partial [Ferrimonas marina]